MFPEEQNPRLKRVGFELRATGIKPEQARDLRSGIHARGYLPHVKREGARYFVTFRLADSLPREFLLQIQAERAERLKRLCHPEADPQNGGGRLRADALFEIDREYFRKLETYLDKGTGACWLRRAEVAEQVAGALRFFDGERYQLKAWVIMANHVHVVLWPLPNHTLSAITQSWKRFTARQVNQLLGRTGEAFWQPESYDHWIRNDLEHWRCCQYVTHNPVKAGLCDAPQHWRWSSAWAGCQKSS
jgi:REP element-mobilizing transposase RayT